MHPRVRAPGDRPPAAAPTRRRARRVLTLAPRRQRSHGDPHAAAASITDPPVVTVRDGSGPAPGTYLDLGAAGLGAESFTISHWYSTTHARPGTLGDVIGNRQAASHGNFISVRINGDGVLAFEVDEDDAGTRYTAVDSGSRRVNDGRWHLLTYTRRGGELAIYIDGEQVARAGSPTQPAAQLRDETPLRIGRSLPPCCANFVAVPGAYADVRILVGQAQGPALAAKPTF
mgnify:CR=1 FL=1